MLQMQNYLQGIISMESRNCQKLCLNYRSGEIGKNVLMSSKTNSSESATKNKTYNRQIDKSKQIEISK